MSAPTRTRAARVTALSSLFVLAVTLPAWSTVTLYPFNNSGPIPQGGTTLSFEQSITDSPYYIDSLDLVLTFSSGYDLGGNIKGTLILDPGGTGAYATFTPSASRPGIGGEQIYDVTLTQFTGYNPNTLWGLSLWDTGNSGIENSLVSWRLEVAGVTPVPEPVNAALAIFGGLAGPVLAFRWRSARQGFHRSRVALHMWMDAVSIGRLMR
jgi:hypothetical protein